MFRLYLQIVFSEYELCYEHNGAETTTVGCYLTSCMMQRGD